VGDGEKRGIVVSETRRGREEEINGQRRVGHRSVYDFWYWREPINPKDNDYKTKSSESDYTRLKDNNNIS
jgi:hypothetical protein